MHTGTIPKEKPTGDGSNLADTDKTLACPRAAYALKGHRLHRADPNDSGAAYWAERWRLEEYLPTIDVARRFVELIGGRL